LVSMIELEDLSMSYLMEGQLLSVLSKVNLCIEEGEAVAIVGPSGSGKTTLLLLLAGLEHPHSGTVRFASHNLADLSVDQLADLRRDQLGIIFQSFHLLPSLTALNNVSLALQMLEKVGLAQRTQHYPSQLSGGEQQRVAIARALIHSPKLVLADEPTGNLDLKTGAKITNLLFKLHEEMGSTLILVTHDDTVAQRCQRILRLQEGGLVEDQQHAFSD
jgi:putative ABC transport system ATP-binding protein